MVLHNITIVGKELNVTTVYMVGKKLFSVTREQRFIIIFITHFLNIL
jgi:hypothetical protein